MPMSYLMDYDTDQDFARRTRFTKEGVQRLAARLDPYLSHETNRGLPLSVVDQVRGHTWVHQSQPNWLTPEKS